MNTGQRGAPVRDSRDLPGACSVTDPNRGRYMTEVTIGREPMTDRREAGEPPAEYVRLESAAVAINDFDPGVFPGLLQTPDYIRALHAWARPQLSEWEIEERVRDRLSRQRLLDTDRPPRLNVIVDEAVLHRGVGGPHVMVQQLEHVIRVSDRENVSVRVLSYEAGAHPALNSTFTLLEFGQLQPSVVYVEGMAGQFYLKRPKDVERYEDAYSALNSMAMPEAQSAKLMEEAMMKHRDVNSRLI